MNFSNISAESLAGKFLRMPLRLIPRGLPVPVLQGPMRGRWWIAGSSANGCWLGSFEYNKQRLFAELARPGDVVFDIGANVGFYTLLAACRVGSSGDVVSFEPLPRNVAQLRRHLRLNHVRNVKVIEAAVSVANGSARFAPHSSNAMGRLSETGTIEVRVISLDALLDAGEIPKPTLMKIDVEGAELDVLRGAARLLDRARPRVVLATHGADVHRSCCSFLRWKGYTLTPVEPSVASIDETDEIVAMPRERVPPVAL